jgi:hypothetical protein
MIVILNPAESLRRQLRRRRERRMLKVAIVCQSLRVSQWINRFR